MVSAWVPESAIVHYPKMAGQPKSANPSQWTGQLYGGEEEVILDRHKPFTVATPEELQDASKHTLHQVPGIRDSVASDYLRNRLAELKQRTKKSEMPPTKEQLSPPNVLTHRTFSDDVFDGPESNQASSVARIAGGSDAKAKVPPVVMDVGNRNKP